MSRMTRRNGRSGVLYGFGNFGAVDSKVLDVQTKLNKLGYPLVLDGIFGPKTAAAIKKYRSDRKLPPATTSTGIDPPLLAMLIVDYSVAPGVISNVSTPDTIAGKSATVNVSIPTKPATSASAAQITPASAGGAGAALSWPVILGTAAVLGGLILFVVTGPAPKKSSKRPR